MTYVGFPSVFLCFFGLIFIFCILCLAFWIWMLVDCVSNEPSQGNDKVVWVLIIALTGAIGAAIYYFVRRPERKRMTGH